MVPPATTVPFRGLRIAVAGVIVTGFLLLAGWLTLPLVQSARAGSMLEEANGRIESANDILASLQLDLLDINGFTSLDAISTAAGSLAQAVPLIEAGSADVMLAREKVEAASGLHLLPGWYGDYLDKKKEIAELREQQLQLLAEASSRLDQLYQAAPLIFQSMQDMDRLLGQLQDSIARTQDEPVASAAELGQIAGSMRAIEQRLDALHQETGFELLKQMAMSVADNAALAEAARMLADAVASGDQDRVQQAASALEQQLLDTTVGVDYLDLWFQNQLNPLKLEYDDLQKEQQQLDAEAAAIYEANSGN